MMSALSFKTMLSLNTSEWGLAVEKELSQGATRDEALKTCECMKLHSVDVTQAYIRAPFPPGHPDLYMELPSLDPQQAKSIDAISERFEDNFDAVIMLNEGVIKMKVMKQTRRPQKVCAVPPRSGKVDGMPTRSTCVEG